MRQILAKLTLVSFLAVNLTSAYAGNGNNGTGNSGNGVGNTGTGNQGNDNPVGNAGGENPGNGNTGGNSGSGNNGNGVGNTGTGNQGNDNPVGNAGGENPGNSNAGGNSGSGNNGNGVGNTGTGNQGNDNPVGNAGGENPGSGNAGDNGNAGGNSGNGNNGNGNGNTGSGNQGNDSDNGNAGGGDNGGGDNGGGDNGGGDNGGGDNGGGDNGGDNGDSVDQTSSETKPGLKFKVLPILFADYDKQVKLINLTPSTGNTKTYNKIELDNFANGLEATIKRDVTVGLGYLGVLSMTNVTGLASLANAALGFLPLSKDSSIEKRYLNQKSELKNLKRLDIPANVEELASWKDGESLTLKTEGGVLFSAGASVAFFGLGSNYMAQGQWELNVTKVDESTVVASVENSKVRNLGLVSGVPIAGLNSAKTTKIGQVFNYAFDLSDAQANEAYIAFMNGDLTVAQNMALTNQNVKFVSATEFKNKKKGITFHFGLPILAYARVSNGREENFATTIYQDSETTVASEYGVYLKESNSRFFKKHKNTTSAFYGGTVVETQKSGLKIHDLTTKFVFSYQNDHTKAPILKTFVKDLIKQTGVEELELSLPDREIIIRNDEEVEKKTKLGYVELQFETSLDKNATYSLLNKLDKFGNEFSKLAYDEVVSYFKNDQDVNGLCEDFVYDVNDSFTWEEGPTDPVLNQCAKYIKNETVYAAKKAIKFAKEINKNINQGGKDFVKAFGKLGKYALKNQFMYQSMLKVLDSRARGGIQRNFTVKGERISTLNKGI